MHTFLNKVVMDFPEDTFLLSTHMSSFKLIYTGPMRRELLQAVKSITLLLSVNSYYIIMTNI